MISHKNVVSTIVSLKYSSIDIFDTDTHMSYLPLPHIFERVVIWDAIKSMSRIAFYSGNVQKIKEDL